MNEHTVVGTNLIARSDLIAKIKARLAGDLSTAGLAAWAFDRFYAEELGNELYEAGSEATIAEVLDALMFCDDTDFGLGEAELHYQIERLQ